MNRMLVVGTGAALLFGAAIALAQEAKAPATDGKAAGTSSMPMMTQMDEHVKKMQALHEKIMGAATPAERQKIMDEGRKEMQQGMMMMMPMMQGGGMMGRGMMDKQKGSHDTETHMKMMGKRIDMMQMMMQMMLDQQGMTAAPSAPESAPKK